MYMFLFELEFYILISPVFGLSMLKTLLLLNIFDKTVICSSRFFDQQ